MPIVPLTIHNTAGYTTVDFQYSTGSISITAYPDVSNSIVETFDAVVVISVDAVVEVSDITIDLLEPSANGYSSVTLNLSTILMTAEAANVESYCYITPTASTVLIAPSTISAGVSVNINPNTVNIVTTIESLSLSIGTSINLVISYFALEIFNPDVGSCACTSATYSTITNNINDISLEYSANIDTVTQYLNIVSPEARQVNTVDIDLLTVVTSAVTVSRVLVQNNPCGSNCTLPNQYFNFRGSCYDNEKFLFSKMTSEAFNMNGVKCDYFVRSYSTNNEKVLGEDNNRQIIGRFPVMVYFDTPPEQRKYNQFGMEDLDNFVMLCTKMLFGKYSKGYLPKYGDLIRPHYNGILYEIVDVIDTEGQFLNTQHTWKFTARVFKNEQTTYAVTPTCATSAENLQTYDSVNAIATEPPDSLQPTSAASSSAQDYLRVNEIVDAQKPTIMYQQTPSIDPFSGW